MSDQQHHPHAERHEPYIEFRNVYKSFGDHRVLEDVSFQVYPGETPCITSWASSSLMKAV